MKLLVGLVFAAKATVGQNWNTDTWATVSTVSTDWGATLGAPSIGVTQSWSAPVTNDVWSAPVTNDVTNSWGSSTNDWSSPSTNDWSSPSTTDWSSPSYDATPSWGSSSNDGWGSSTNDVTQSWGQAPAPANDYTQGWQTVSQPEDMSWVSSSFASAAAPSNPFAKAQETFDAPTTVFSFPQAPTYVPRENAPVMQTAVYQPLYQPFYQPLYQPSYQPSYQPLYQRYVAPEPEQNDEGAEYIFDTSVIRKYNLILKPKDLATLDNDPTAEEYVPCDITTDYGSPEAVTYYRVGCRYKGALGSLVLCTDSQTGRATGGCRKLSWKVDANKFRDDKQKINGLKKLNFNGMAVDLSLMSERIAYGLFKFAGITAPRAVHSEIYVNGKYDGLFTNVEEVDERFTKSRFGDNDANKGKGAVYKDFWPIAENLEKLDDWHSAGKKEHKFMREVVKAIEQATDATAEKVLEHYFDTESIVDVTALNTLMGQTDDWRLRHNFKFYVHEKFDGSKKLVMIPWDYDRLNDGAARDVRAELGQWYNLNDPTLSCTFLSQSPAQKAMAYPATERAYQLKVYNQYPPRYGVPIQCDKVTQMIAVVLRDRVKQRIKELDARLPSAAISNKIDTVANEIRAIVDVDPDWPEPPQWREANTEFKDFLRESRRQAVQFANNYNQPIKFVATANAVKSNAPGYGEASSGPQWSSINSISSSSINKTPRTYSTSSTLSSFRQAQPTTASTWGQSTVSNWLSQSSPTSFGSFGSSFGSSGSLGNSFSSFGR